MRSVKVGAIQPNYLRVPDRYHWLQEGNQAPLEEILGEYVAKQLDITLQLLKKAGKAGCDIVTTCEDMTGISFWGMDLSEQNRFPELADRAARMAEERLSELARRYSMYIVGCYDKRVGDNVFNTASLFDRTGAICGEYRKTHLPPDEKWQVSEGSTTEVFQTDFGKIGLCICYDMMFPEFVQVLALKGAEIIFHPTAGYGWYDSIGEATLRTRANDHSVYIVTAKNYIFNGAGKSSVIDFWGQTLVDAGFYENVLVTCDLDLEVEKTQPEWFFPVPTSGIQNLRTRKLAERRPELYGDIADGSLQTRRLEAPGPDQKREILRKIQAGQCHW